MQIAETADLELARRLQAEWEAEELTTDAATAALLARLTEEEVTDREAAAADETLARRLQDEEACVTPPGCIPGTPSAAMEADDEEDAALARRLQMEEDSFEQASMLECDAALARELADAEGRSSRKRPSQKQRRQQESERSVGLAHEDDGPAGACWHVAGLSVAPAVPAWSPGIAMPAAVREPPRLPADGACAPMEAPPHPGRCPLPLMCEQRHTFSRAVGSAGAEPGLLLVIDGANVAYRYDGRFRSRSVRLCLEFWRQAGVPAARMRVTLSESNWDETDAELVALDAAGAIAWSPLGKDDDLFTIQTAALTGAWVVTNDQFRNHARWTSQVGRRLLRFSFATTDVFVATPDDVERFLRDVRIRA